MKTTIKVPTEVEIAAVRICIPLRYDDDGGMDCEFPLRNGKTWEAIVNIDTGEIRDWPRDKMGPWEIYEKVCDGGTYELLSADGNTIASIDGDYVPSVVPGEYGDYVTLNILDGKITNWPRNPDVSDFFRED